MKKRFLAMTLLLAMALSLCVSAAPRYDESARAEVYLNFDGTTASCSVDARGDSGISINVNLTLYHMVNGKAIQVKQWSGLTGTTSMDYTGYYNYAVPGDQYKLTVTGTVGRDHVNNSVLATCR